MELHYKVNSRVLWLAAIGAVMVCCSYLTFAYDPLQFILKKVLTLAPGSIFYNLWSAPPYEILININIFNVTNAEHFLNGTDPKLNFTEIGPYVYQEILTNENTTFNDDGTITFSPNRKMVLDRKRSVGDPKVDRVIVPNIPLLGIQSFLNDKPFYTRLGFSSLSNILGAKSLVNLTLDEYLWGYEDRLVEVANDYIPSWIDFKRFGIVDRFLSVDNGNVVTVATEPELQKNLIPELSYEDNMRKYHIVNWNGSPGLPKWGYEKSNNSQENKEINKCQLIAGAYEGSLFPNFMQENTTYKLFRAAFCRPIPLEYTSTGKSYHGFDVFNYGLNEYVFETPEVNPDNACYCVKGRCLPKGLGYLSPCYYGIPITMSQPHFLRSDPKLVEQVNGVNPDEKLHASIAQIHPTFGVPIDGHLKIQINLDIGETTYNYKTKPFNGLHIPLFWLEFTMGEFPSVLYYLLTWTCHILPVVQVVLMYSLGILGLALISFSALVFLFFNRPTISGTISLKTEYSALPTIMSNPQQYFRPDIRISK